ncbi:MAG: hypothetical protein ACRC28_13440 [Clostridium sp.]|uniref:hypothetical protein n=1 Tax=Clostridium sp. TaxID=1506 RepID=UPI003F30892C
MKTKKFIKAIIGMSMITILLAGCGSQEEKPPVVTDIEAKKEEYMDMKEKYKAVFETENEKGEKLKYSVMINRAERTTDRTTGLDDMKDVTIITYEYELLEGDGELFITSGDFLIKDQDGEALEKYAGYQDFNAEKVSKGKKCKAQMVFGSKDKKLEGITAEIVDPVTKKVLGKWNLKLQQRNYITG